MQHPNAFGHKIQIISQIDQIKDPASAKYLRDCQYKNPTHFHKLAKISDKVFFPTKGSLFNE